MSARIERPKNAYELLYADRWSGDDYAAFKADHVGVYPGTHERSRPPALRQLLDAGKIDLNESRAIERMLFGLDSAYEDAIGQTATFERRAGEAVSVLTRAIPYGDGTDVMAIPVEPGILIGSQDLKWAMRGIFIMNSIQRRHVESLQSARKEARDELTEYLSSRAPWILDQEE